MKSIARLVGAVVIVLALACGILYHMNTRGWLTGSLAELVDSITNHVKGISTETRDYLEDEGFIGTPVPTIDPALIATPAPTD